jgi:hypothetical protein
MAIFRENGHADAVRIKKNENLRSLSFQDFIIIKDCRDRACPCPKRKGKPKLLIFV